MIHFDQSSDLSSIFSSYPTLKVLSERRPDIPIYVGDTSRPVFWLVKRWSPVESFVCWSVAICFCLCRYLEQSEVQLTNINIVPFGVWQDVSQPWTSGSKLVRNRNKWSSSKNNNIFYQMDEHLRFMILMDGIHPEMDTCIIVEYKGAVCSGTSELWLGLWAMNTYLCRPRDLEHCGLHQAQRGQATSECGLDDEWLCRGGIWIPHDLLWREIQWWEVWIIWIFFD